MRAGAHPQNVERLETLRKYAVLDTPAEEEFDEVVSLAAEICNKPVSLISLVDEDRQWFKAMKGLSVRQTPIEQSICAHAILNGEIFEIEDTQKDPRTADNPLCMGEDALRFYAGVPLIAQDGLPLGSLCVLDRKPARLSDFQRRALQVLSRQVMNQLDLRVALETQRVLQAEADHRVKNSLQSIAAIVRVYGRSVSDPAAKEAFSSVQRRIDATAALHKQLEHTDGIDMIDTADYLDRVMRLLSDSAPENISFRLHCDEILMRSHQVTNLAMIISEFVANALKHAFPKGHPGEVSVRLTVQEPGNYLLVCTDDGIGDRGGQERTGKVTGIGLSLVKAAADSLGGKSRLSLSPRGSKLTLSFGELSRSRGADDDSRRMEEG